MAVSRLRGEYSVVALNYSALGISTLPTRFVVVLPRDAMLSPRGINVVVMCLSVRPSVTSRNCIETIGRIEVVSGTDRPTFFYLSSDDYRF